MPGDDGPNRDDWQHGHAHLMDVDLLYKATACGLRVVPLPKQHGS